MPDWLISIIQITLIPMGFVMTLAGLLTLLGDRKQSAAIQNRVGPNRASIFGITFLGLPHLIADTIKLILKENTIPNGANKILFLLAPGLVVAPALMAWAAIPFMDQYCTGTIFTNSQWQEVCIDGQWENYFQIMNFNSGLLYIFAIAAVSVYGSAIAGWSSNNNYSLLGGLRSSAQMISYEVSMGLSLAGIIMIFGSLNLNEISRLQGELIWGWLPKWGIVVQPVAFFVFFLAGMAETKRAPFDLPEGESEIVAGHLTEYSSMKFAIMQAGEYAATVVIAGLITMLFLGGWQVPWLFGDGIRFGDTHIHIAYWLVIVLRILAVIAKIVLIVWLQFMMRWTLPRFRYDQVMVLGWKILLPISLANLVVTAIIVAII